MTPRGRDLPALGVALATWVLVASWLVAGPFGVLLTWDEVDYLNAARMGVAANALDAGGLGYGGLAEMVGAKSRGGAPSLPAAYDEATDPVVVRHYHPPGTVYPHVLVAREGSERRARAPLLAGLLLFLALFCVTAGRVAPPPGPWGWGVIGVLAGWLGLSGFTLIQGHGWMAAWTLALALGLGTWRGRGWSPGRWLTLGALVLSGLTLESAAILWVASAVLLLRDGARWNIGRRDVALTFATAGALVVIFWPGALLNGSPAHIAALYAYRIVFGEEYSGLVTRVGASIAPYLPLLVLAIGAFALSRGRGLGGAGATAEGERSTADDGFGAPRVVGALALLAAAYGVPMLLAAMGPRYLLPAAAPAALLALKTVLARRDRVGLAVAAAFTVAVVGWTLRPSDAVSDAQARADVAAIAQAGEGRTVWADGGHILRWYHPELSVRDLTVSWDGGTLTRRVAGAYAPVGWEDLRGGLVVIVRWRDAHPHPPAALQGCRRTPLNTVSLYDC